MLTFPVNLWITQRETVTVTVLFMKPALVTTPLNAMGGMVDNEQHSLKKHKDVGKTAGIDSRLGNKRNNFLLVNNLFDLQASASWAQLRKPSIESNALPSVCSSDSHFQILSAHL
jgi:hypothetical protein